MEFLHYGISYEIRMDWAAMEWELYSGRSMVADGTTCGEELHDDTWRGYLSGNREAREALLDAARDAAMGAAA